MSYEVRAVITKPLTLGEGPHWDHNQQVLYFVDIIGETIHRYAPDSETHTKTQFDDGVNFIIPVEGTTDQFVVGAGRRFLIIRWDGEDGSKVEVVRQLGEVDQHEPENRINDGKADPRGRLFAGTMHWSEGIKPMESGKGSLYHVAAAADGDFSMQAVAGQIRIANGLAWDLREKAFYYIDSLEHNVRRYDYDVETGNISNQTFIFDLRKNGIDEGIPDGMTIDTDGHLWVAVYNGSCVLKVDPRTGTLLQKIPIPAKQVTSVTFGGPELDVLFVTTGSLAFGGAQPPPGGATYTVTGLGVKGHPNVNFKL